MKKVFCFVISLAFIMTIIMPLSALENNEDSSQTKNGEIQNRSEKVLKPSITYCTHVQTYGWQEYVSDGGVSGTTGQSKRLEGIKINIQNSIGGSIQYRTHVQTYGWQGFVSENAMSGTSGQSKRLEAIQIQLTGEMANQYDIYYRVHAQNFGWLD